MRQAPGRGTRSSNAHVVVVLLAVALSFGRASGGPRGRPRAFLVGFNKTGTRTLAALLDALGLRACHTTAWARQARLHNETWFEAPGAPGHACDAFSDGSKADYRWLDDTFPGSAFALNTRRLDAWLVSRFAHVALNVRRAKSTAFSDNSDCAVRCWVKEREEYHAAVLDHFCGGAAATGSCGEGNVRPPRKSAFWILDATSGTQQRERLCVIANHIAASKRRRRAACHRGTAFRRIAPHIANRPQPLEDFANGTAAVARVLDNLGVKPNERAGLLLVGRPTPPLAGSRCRKCWRRRV